MAGLAKKMTIKALQQVTGVDMISIGMQSYYHGLSKRKGEICHRYLPPNTIPAISNLPGIDASVLNVGHIGSIYDNKDFLRFLDLLKAYGKLKGIKVNMNMWGYHPKKNAIPMQYFDILKIHNDLPEEEVIPQLEKSDFVYAMYPFSSSQRIFGRTSLPTKLTSYVQAGRPIFGQGPSDSSLAEFLQSTGTGVIWLSETEQEGVNLIENILNSAPDLKNWKEARENYFGEKNLAVIRNAFMANP